MMQIGHTCLVLNRQERINGRQNKNENAQREKRIGKNTTVLIVFLEKTGKSSIFLSYKKSLTYV